VASKVNISERIKPGQGVGIFFQKDSELNTKQDNDKDNAQNDEQDNNKGSEQSSNNDNEQGTTQYTNNVTNKYTVETPVKSELVDERLVANVTRSQKKYIKETAKKFENESAFVRYMIDYFRKNIEIK
jgi:hypothetical protein